MGASRIRTGRALLALAGAVALAVGLSVAATGQSATASSLKGSSCAHPYEVHLGEQKGLYVAPLVGDTHYITRTKRTIPNKHVVFGHRGVFHISYAWRARNGAKMCEFHVWEVVRYEISPGHFGRWQVRQNILDSHNPRGGANVVEPVLETTYAEALKIGESEVREVLTAAR